MTMANPIPGRSVSTPYGERGSHWSCQKDSAGRGIHTGLDIAAPNGTKIYAPIAGQIRHRSYGSAFGKHQFAISPDPSQPFADGEVFFAHTRTRLPDGKRVEVGDFIAEVGSEGNVTGPHLHMEFMPSSKGRWKCGIHADPQKIIDHKEGTTMGKVFLSKLVYGQQDSDSVRRMQAVLNGISLDGGRELPITGNYGDQTLAEFEKWTAQKADDPSYDAKGRPTLAQAQQLFAGTGHTLVDDIGVDEPEPDEPTTETVANLFKHYSGKPSGEMKVLPDGEWHHLAGLDEPASGRKGGSEKRLLYLRLEFTPSRTADRVVETKFVRANGDATAYDSEEFGTTKDSYPYQNVHFEDGDGAGGKWYVKVTGGKDPMTISTRYAKLHTIFIG